MSGVVKKLIIFAGLEGLILQPLTQKEKRSVTSPVRISYNDNSIVPALKESAEGDTHPKSFEAFGIVGVLTFAKSSFLISIIRRQQVAQIQGKPIYVVTEVALTPLASRAEAESAISNTRLSLSKRAESDGLDYSDTDGEDGDPSGAMSDGVDDDDVPLANPTGSNEHERTNSVAEDVIARKGGYGRFAQSWFSRGGWTIGQRRNLGMSGSESNTNSFKAEPLQPSATEEHVSQHESDAKKDLGTSKQRVKDVTEQLLPKLLRTTSILFGSSQSFYFSYDWDITRSFATQTPIDVESPDPLYFWNRHLIKPFVDVGQSGFIVPLMQGFVGQRSFVMDINPPILGLDGAEKSSMELVDFSPPSHFDENGASQLQDRRQSSMAKSQKHFLLTLISRRSVKRAGLRYLRRGINEDGDTANGVETEQILSDPSWNQSKKIYSFLQIRGSIPIYFSQSPYSFKPIPQLQHSEDINFLAFTKHFKALESKYGNIQIASLVEKHGNEAIVGDAYQKYFNRLKESDIHSGVSAEWWDFHALCKGMRFENVSLLLDLMAKNLDSFSDTVKVDNHILRKQSGVLRTNCMDCLDRTNVVQSAVAKKALEKQLNDQGIDMSLQVDQATQWFNDLWADNGDACSKAYASTAAMKGDFTRTRKRDFQGALKDMGISMARFYSGIVNDYFSQAAIDFLLGNTNNEIWSDFEANLMTGDPAVSMHRLRQQAIETCQKIVVANDKEEFIGGWNLLMPQVPNTIKSTPFEESVLLLTDAALYSCRLDWTADKVSSFERVDLQHIKSINYGTYVTSTLSSSQRDEERNVGFIVAYRAGADDVTRVNSRAVSNIRPRNEADLLDGSSISPPHTPPVAPNPIGKATANSQPEPRILALKALSTRSAITDENPTGLSEMEQVKSICYEIERMVLHGRVAEVGTERKPLVVVGDIITLAEARKSTGLLEQLSHSLKKLVWA